MIRVHTPFARHRESLTGAAGRQCCL